MWRSKYTHSLYYSSTDYQGILHNHFIITEPLEGNTSQISISSQLFERPNLIVVYSLNQNPFCREENQPPIQVIPSTQHHSHATKKANNVINQHSAHWLSLPLQ
jgi:hypothetical protein